MEYGEIAVNYHKNTESLFIKNDDGEVKTFRADNQLPPVEKHDGQEFVYRQAVNENEAKSLELTRIYGKTLAWNQLVKNGDLSVGTDFWVIYQTSTFSVSNKVATLTWTSPYSNNAVGQNTKTFTSGHKFYVAATIKNLKDSTRRYFVGQTYGVRVQADFAANEKKRISGILDVETGDGQGYGALSIGGNPKTENSVEFTNVVCFDLTLMFGAGNEPSTVAEFESMFPGYHDYEAGKLISNDAESIETVGFNLWDEETRNGYYNDSGDFVANGGWLCNKNLIPVFENTTYYIQSPKACRLLAYDANGTFLSSIGYYGQTTFTTPDGTRFINFHVLNTYGNVYNHDICINLSDPTKNGTYEPYRKSTMQLGLNNFKVKSHNIWDEVWEVGGFNSTGEPADQYNTCIRAKNYCAIKPNTTYYLKTPVGSAIFIYDSSKTYVTQYNGNNGTTFTTPFNAAFFKFGTQLNTITTYNNNVCLNESSSFNGQYESHGDITITGGLKSAGSARDEIVGNKYIKRVGSVDMGADLSWTYGSPNFISSPISDITTESVPSVPSNIVCSKYKTVKQDGFVDTDKSIIKQNYSSANDIVVHDSAYSDAATFKTAVSGVMLNYKLATPIEYTLVSPLVPIVKAGTTEERISPNSDGLSAPMVCDMQYTMDNDYVVGEFNQKLGDIQTILQTI